MGIREQLGLDVKQIINAAGPLSIYCGCSPPKEVIDAMMEALRTPMRMDELQAAASRFISKITGAEAGYVTSGAAAALMAGAAACMTGYEVSRINALPDTSGMPNEVIIGAHQLCSYEHSIRAVGAKIVTVGMPSHVLPAGELYQAQPEDYEVAITDRTAAIVYFYSQGAVPPLEEVIAISRKYNVPVMVDAAGQVPPVENLRRFISKGADLVALSGGKEIRGPQASGLLFGRRDLIAAAALNYFTPGHSAGFVSYSRWQPPASLVSKDKVRGVPHHPICRALKVSREAIVGLLTALRLLIDEKRTLAEMKRFRLLLAPIAKRIEDIPGVMSEMAEVPVGGYPVIKVEINSLKLGRSALTVVERLEKGEPPIYFISPDASRGRFTIHPCSLNEEEARIVAERLYTAMTT
jgi:D-glucosaminate-6-phosphate ammonia-lyase